MDSKPNRRLVLVSNRLPFQLLEKNKKVTLKQSDGGLVTALKSYFESESTKGSFDQKIWLGSADFPKARWDKYLDKQETHPHFGIEPLFIENKIYNKYYNGFCNATVWPLFHYFTSYMIFDEDYFQNYETVNRLFADKLLEIIQPGDVIWVHDYHLFLLPEMIREKIPEAMIGFFLHIPFPSYEILRLMHRPWKEKIIKGLLGADLIGFHTQEYVQHFLKTVRMVTGFDHQYRSILFSNRVVKVDIFPLGIDFKKFNDTIKNEEVIELRDGIKKNFPESKIIFSIDRLDYTKGITHRLAGFERFLERHPEWFEKVVFVCGVVPSREIISKYNERRKLIEEQVGRINGKYSTLKWQPLIYRYSHLSFEELSALYQAADVALITPLRDGMNLVAKEYLACRDTHEGVLILSELAGAASELGEAVLVNPNDLNEIAESISLALAMPQQEQQRRLSFMQKRLSDYDVQHWVDDFLHQLNEVKVEQEYQKMKFIDASVKESIVDRFHKSKNRCLLLDYDGTLVPFARHPREATPDDELHRLLKKLASANATQITIISGRDSAILEEWFDGIDVNLVAEHGASIKRNGNGWEHEKELDQSWKPLIRPTLEMFAKRCPRSFVEEKSHTLAWHYRNVESEFGFVRSRELLDSLYHLVRNAQLQVIDGNRVIEVRLSGVDKGAAAKKLVEDNDYDIIIAVGDDKTDEDMFAALADQAITVKVGPGPTKAQYSLPAQSDVIELLNQFTSN
jgi:trehalose 6-phosphate synthase/phosphatase